MYRSNQALRIDIPFLLVPVQAGFPSPADDYMEQRLDLSKYLIKHPAATIFVKVTDDSMIKAGIFEGDLLIVDKSMMPCNNKVVLAVCDGNMIVRRIKTFKNRSFLIPENKDYRSIEIYDDLNLEIIGVVTNVIHYV